MANCFHLDDKGIKFKLPPGWRRDGLAHGQAKHESLTIQEIDWNAPNKRPFTRWENPNFHDRVSQWISLVWTPYDKLEEMLEHKLDHVTSAAQSGAPGSSYSDVKTVKVSGNDGVFVNARRLSEQRNRGSVCFYNGLAIESIKAKPKKRDHHKFRSERRRAFAKRLQHARSRTRQIAAMTGTEFRWPRQLFCLTDPGLRRLNHGYLPD